MKDIVSIRKSYSRSKLDTKSVNPDPIKQFNKWFEEALKSEINEPTAMILSTATVKGMPSSRTVLLIGIDPQGYVFYTNYGSKKGTGLLKNPNDALNILLAGRDFC